MTIPIELKILVIDATIERSLWRKDQPHLHPMNWFSCNAIIDAVNCVGKQTIGEYTTMSNKDTSDAIIDEYTRVLANPDGTHPTWWGNGFAPHHKERLDSLDKLRAYYMNCDGA